MAQITPYIALVLEGGFVEFLFFFSSPQICSRSPFFLFICQDLGKVSSINYILSKKSIYYENGRQSRREKGEKRENYSFTIPIREGLAIEDCSLKKVL